MKRFLKLLWLRWIYQIREIDYETALAYRKADEPEVEYGTQVEVGSFSGVQDGQTVMFVDKTDCADPELVSDQIDYFTALHEIGHCACGHHSLTKWQYSMHQLNTEQEAWEFALANAGEEPEFDTLVHICAMFGTYCDVKLAGLWSLMSMQGDDTVQCFTPQFSPAEREEQKPKRDPNAPLCWADIENAMEALK